MSNISIGIAERLAQLFLTGYFISIFQYVHDHYSLFTIPSTILSWIILFLLTDLIWYWYHRLSHEINILWGAHIVHHSSEEYNYTVSLRITIYQSVVRLFFGLILPIIGFPVPMLLISISVLGIYQFFIHTRFISSLGFLEYILVTPSNHRVHHGSNEIYLDKNFGGILIIWDKLFGTYQKETEEVKYGLTKPVQSNSFLWLHFHFWLELIEHVKATKGFFKKWNVLFGRPGDLKTSYETKLRDRYLSESNFSTHQIKKDNYPLLYNYVRGQLWISLFLLFSIYLIDFDFLPNLLLSGIITFSIINCCAILEQKKWVLNIEIIRILFIYLLIVSFSKQFYLITFCPLLLMLIVEDYRWFKIIYFKKLYKRKQV